MKLGKQMSIGIVLTYVGQFIHILSGLIYTPIMLRLLGQSEYGLFQLVSSTVGYLGIMNLGFGGAYMRFYSQMKMKKESENEIASLNGMFLAIFMVLALLALAAGVIMIANIQNIFNATFTDSEVEKARILMIFLVFNLAASFPLTIFDCYIMAHEQFIFQKAIVVLQYFLNPFLTLPLLLLGYGSVAMVSVTTGLLLLKCIANIVFCIKKLHIRFSMKRMRFRLLTEIGEFTFFIFLNQIVDQINWSLDKFLLGIYSGTTAVAIYAVAANLNNMYQQFSNAVPSVFVTRVNLSVARNDELTEINKMFYTVGRIQFMVLGLIASGFIVFGRKFISLWAGDGYSDSYQIALLLMVPALIPYIQGLGYEIQRAMNKHRARSIAYFFVAVANLFVSIPCIKMWGARGAALGTALTFILGHGLFMNWYYHKVIGLNMFVFWGKMISILLVDIVIVSLSVLLLKKIVIYRWAELFVGIVLYTLLYVIIMFIFGMNENERKLVISKVSKCLSKVSR